MMKDNRGLPIVRVRLEQDRAIGKESVNTQDKAVEYIIREFADLDREVFMILNLDTALRPINLNVVSMGTLSETMVHPREVFKASILSNASSVICIHNHPGGDVTPSDPDIAVTNRLTECGKILGIEVADHLIIGGRDGTYFSFQESARANMQTMGMTENERAAEKRL
jgi:DNA repair protein RadC